MIVSSHFYGSFYWSHDSSHLTARSHLEISVHEGVASHWHAADHGGRPATTTWKMVEDGRGVEDGRRLMVWGAQQLVWRWIFRTSDTFRHSTSTLNLNEF